MESNIEEYSIHELKTWKEYFEDVIRCRKKFEVRKDDRGFKVGDFLMLQEFDNELKKYTGRKVMLEVRYILKGGQFGINEGFVVIGF